MHTLRTAHPGWCDPRSCTATPTEVLHSSELVELQFLDCTVELWVSSTSECPDPEVNVCVTSTTLAQTGGTAWVHLLPHECTVLADRLLIERERARLMSAPALTNHPAAA